jgi:hypothetical protein
MKNGHFKNVQILSKSSNLFLSNFSFYNINIYFITIMVTNHIFKDYHHNFYNIKKNYEM